MGNISRLYVMKMVNRNTKLATDQYIQTKERRNVILSTTKRCNSHPMNAPPRKGFIRIHGLVYSHPELDSSTSILRNKNSCYITP